VGHARGGRIKQFSQYTRLRRDNFAFADPGEFEAALRRVRSHGIAVYSATAINWAVLAVLSLASAAALAVAWG